MYLAMRQRWFRDNLCISVSFYLSAISVGLQWLRKEEKDCFDSLSWLNIVTDPGPHIAYTSFFLALLLFTWLSSKECNGNSALLVLFPFFRRTQWVVWGCTNSVLPSIFPTIIYKNQAVGFIDANVTLYPFVWPDPAMHILSTSVCL